MEAKKLTWTDRVLGKPLKPEVEIAFVPLSIIGVFFILFGLTFLYNGLMARGLPDAQEPHYELILKFLASGLGFISILLSELCRTRLPWLAALFRIICYICIGMFCLSWWIGQ